MSLFLVKRQSLTPDFAQTGVILVSNRLVLRTHLLLNSTFTLTPAHHNEN